MNLPGAICCKESIDDIRQPSLGVEMASILLNVAFFASSSARRLTLAYAALIRL